MATIASDIPDAKLIQELLNSPGRRKSRRKQSNDPLYTKLMKIQSFYRGHLLRKRLKEKLSIFIFGKAITNYVRRYRRKCLKKPVFRFFKDLFAMKYLYGQNIDRIKIIQIHFKNRSKRRKDRINFMLNLLNKLFNRNKLSTFQSIRLKNPNNEKLSELRNNYMKILIETTIKTSMKRNYQQLINTMHENIEKKKNNFVFNYFVNSFEKNLKFYLSKWKRISRKMMHDDFMLNQEEDEDVIDVEEERKRIENNKQQNLIVKKFRIIALQKLKSDKDILKERINQWKEKSVRIKVAFFRDRNKLKQVEIENDANKRLVEENLKKMRFSEPSVIKTLFSVEKNDYESIKKIISKFAPETLAIGENTSNQNNEALILEIIRRYGTWKQIHDKNYKISLISREDLFEIENPYLNFTLESNQIHYQKGFKTNKNYELGLLFKKVLETEKKKQKFFFKRWEFNSLQMDINDSLSDITKIMRNAIDFKVVEEYNLSLLFSNKPQPSFTKSLKLLQIKDHTQTQNEKLVKQEDIDDYYEINYKHEFGRKVKDFEDKKKQFIKRKVTTQSSIRSRRFSLRESLIKEEATEYVEYVDHEKEDLENPFLKIYGKKVEKETPNDEDDLDDETRRYLVNFENHEEEEEEKFQDNFEERLRKKKRNQETVIEFVKNDDEFDLNYDLFDIQTLGDITKFHKKNIIAKNPQNKIEEKFNEIKIDYNTDNDSDVSIDELRNYKKAMKIGNNEAMKFKKMSSNVNDFKINLKPRYVDFYQGGEKYFAASKKEKNVNLPTPTFSFTKQPSKVK